jgi:hypothetical protein
MLSSWSARLYSEHLAVFGLLLSLFGYFYRARKWPLTFLSAGAFVTMTTKSAFFPFSFILLFWAFTKKEWLVAASLSLALLLNWPIHQKIEKGRRGLVQVSAMVTRLEVLDSKVIAKCSVYNLSQSLGRVFFPEVEGACRLNGSPVGTPMAETQIIQKTLARVFETDFSYLQGLKIILNSPFKYALLALSSLPTPFWSDGIEGTILSKSPEWLKQCLWVFKVVFSTALWLICVNLLIHFRKRRFPSQITVIAAPILYLLLFNMNMPAEQRHFMPALPLLYLLCIIRLGVYYSPNTLSRQEIQKSNTAS